MGVVEVEVLLHHQDFFSVGASMVCISQHQQRCCEHYHFHLCSHLANGNRQCLDPSRIVTVEATNDVATYSIHSHPFLF